MTDIIDYYKTLTKENLVSAYKHFLRENERFRKRKDGFGKNNGNGLERPKINGEVYSWTAFSKLPKDAIIVHTFMLGIDKPYLENLTKEGLFIQPSKEVKLPPWEKDDKSYKLWLWGNNKKQAIKLWPTYFGYPPNGIRGQNYWKWMDENNPNEIYGPQFGDEDYGKTIKV